MKENQLLRTALRDDVDGFAPMAVSPSAPLGFVFIWQILRVINEHVGAFGQFAHVAVKDGMTRLVVGGIHEDSIVGFETETKTSLGMIKPHRFHDAIVKLNALFFHVVKIAMRCHFAHIHREIWIGHLFLNGTLQAASATGRVEEEIVIRVLIQRLKKWDALNVIPVEMREKHVGIDGIGVALCHEALAQISETGSAIKHVDVVIDANLHAGGVSTVLHVLQLRRWSRSTHTPESDFHASPTNGFQSQNQKQQRVEILQAPIRRRREIPEYMPAGNFAVKAPVPRRVRLP